MTDDRKTVQVFLDGDDWHVAFGRREYKSVSHASKKRVHDLTTQLQVKEATLWLDEPTIVWEAA